MKTAIMGCIVLSTLVAFIGCKADQDGLITDQNDYRTKFCGDFSFEVIAQMWNISSGISWDTIYYDGVIRKYELSDSEANLCVAPQNPNPNPKEKVTMEFLNHSKITSLISEEGLLIPKQCYHYYHQGGFTSMDTIAFDVTGLGGLGGGVNYYITGVRKER